MQDSWRGTSTLNILQLKGIKPQGAEDHNHDSFSGAAAPVRSHCKTQTQSFQFPII